MSASTSSEFVRAMGPVARELLGEPNAALSSRDELRFGSRGSLCVDLVKGVFRDHEAGKDGGVLDLVQYRKHLDRPAAIAWMQERQYLTKSDTTKTKCGPGRQVGWYDYHAAAGEVLFQVVRFEPKDFRQRRPDGKGGWIWKMAGVQLVPYQLPKVIEAVKQGQTVYIAEGEKGVHSLESIGLVGTCSPGGAGKWSKRYNATFAGADVVVLPDYDPQSVDKQTGEPRWHPDGRPVLPGQDHAANVARSLTGTAKRVRVLMLPDLPPKGDVADWIAAGGTRDQLEELGEAVGDEIQRPPPPEHDDGPPADWDDPGYEDVPESETESQAAAESVATEHEGIISLDDFYAYMPMHNYIYAPGRAHWPAASVNSRLPPVKLTDANGKPVLGENGKQIKMPAATWLDKHQPVEQMTWAPGLPMVIKDKLILEGGWFRKVGAGVFNLYRPPEPIPNGDPSKAQEWLDHINFVYPTDAGHIISWLAHRVQHPEQKINHALVLGGDQGIGKDTLLEPVKHGIGPWNFQEASPKQILGRFNGFLKAVILRVSEARDLGEFDRFGFYDHMKTYTAAPPDTLRVDEKHLREHNIPNVCGVIITTNHKNDGIFLPEDDRRHYVAWSTLQKEDPKFQGGYWQEMWKWYEAGGIAHVVAYLRGYDLSNFDPKAPPPKTEAWRSIVDSNRPAEESELADAIGELDDKRALTVIRLKDKALDAGLVAWLEDRKNRRTIPYRLEKCGYVPVRNPAANDGLWVINKKRQAIYAKASRTLPEQIKDAEWLTGLPPSPAPAPEPDLGTAEDYYR